MKRAVDIGPVDAAAIKTAGGKVRLRLLFSVEQLEALLIAAHDEADGAPDDRAEDEREARSKVTPDNPAARVFVIQGTPAWDAWMAHKMRVTGHEWTLTSIRDVEGKSRTGWWFPTLFPPKESNSEHQERGEQC